VIEPLRGPCPLKATGVPVISIKKCRKLSEISAEGFAEAIARRGAYFTITARRQVSPGKICRARQILQQHSLQVPITHEKTRQPQTALNL
jgi:hypothetical protein